MHRTRFVFFLLLVGSWPLAAHAAESDQGAFPTEAPPERRSGLVLGIETGVGVVGASGYPNNASKIDDPNYHVSSGAAFGSGTTFMLMGALADSLNFGVWFGGGRYENDNYTVTGAGGGLRVEAFPLYALVPRLRDLGVFGQFGVGGSEAKPKRGNPTVADGTESFLGAGFFYEFRLFNMLGGHFTLAPTIQYQAIASRPFEQHGGMAGVRVAFYGGP